MKYSLVNTAGRLKTGLRHGRSTMILLLAALAASPSCGSNGGSGYPTGPGPANRELDSGDLASGATYTHRFDSAGTFRYHCLHHTPMTGSVVVNEAAIDTLVTLHIVSDVAPFPAASVRPGGRVVWKNDMAMVHTVTSN